MELSSANVRLITSCWTVATGGAMELSSANVRLMAFWMNAAMGALVTFTMLKGAVTISPILLVGSVNKTTSVLLEEATGLELPN